MREWTKKGITFEKITAALSCFTKVTCNSYHLGVGGPVAGGGGGGGIRTFRYGLSVKKKSSCYLASSESTMVIIKAPPQPVVFLRMSDSKALVIYLTIGALFCHPISFPPTRSVPIFRLCHPCFRSETRLSFSRQNERLAPDAKQGDVSRLFSQKICNLLDRQKCAMACTLISKKN